MIIGLTGFSRVGKDTLCEHLENFRRFAFADVLKRQVTAMLARVGIEVDLWGKDKEEWRDMLVFWGRKMRMRDMDYWIKQLILELASQKVDIEEDRVCITDVRYLNEIRWIESKGGLVIGLDRPGYGPANPEEGITIREIRIQRPQIQWLNNDGTQYDLAVAARNIIRAFNSRHCLGSVVF